MNSLYLFADYLAQAFNTAPNNTLASEIDSLQSGDCHKAQIYKVSADDRQQSTIMERLQRAVDKHNVALVTSDCSEAAMTPARLRLQLENHGINVAFAGSYPGNAVERGHESTVAVIEQNPTIKRRTPPPEFRVVAIMPAYNEEDIIDQTIRYLVEQQIEVHVIDNWSTDSTFEQAHSWLGRGLIGIERFPAAGPALCYEWRRILGRVEELSASISADWLVLHDCDERRRSPWREINYRSGIYYADLCGFNCIDHVVLNHWPAQDQFDPRRDVEQQITSCSFSDHSGHFHQRKAWKNSGVPVALEVSAGHHVTFNDRRVYPFKFLLKHYPIRCQSQAERKLFRDRIPRWDAHERALGWHAQYDAVHPGQRFIWDPSNLCDSTDPTFYERFLIERLSGIGVFKEVPAWATKPIARCVS